MAVRSKLLAATTQVLQGATRDVYTVPAGRTAIVRHWSCVNRTGEARNVIVSVRTGGAVVNLQYSASLANGAVMTQPVAELVLGPGDSFGVFQDGPATHSGVHVVLAGSLLAGVAS